MEQARKGVETFCPVNRQHWRVWLEEHHAAKQSIWLIYHKKRSGKPPLTWSEAVDEALCFGWIDSRAKPIDEDNYMQFFSPRKPLSGWSKINKEKVQSLINSGLMSNAGLSSIATAKQNGSWLLIDEVEAGVIPEDLEAAFQKEPGARSYFLNLSRSDQRTMLQWLVLAKRPETRQNRIRAIVVQAGQPVKSKPRADATKIQ